MNKIVESWTAFDIRLASILVYNCFFFLNNIDDLAIKESATNSIKVFLIKSAGLDLKNSDKNLLETNFVNEIKSGLRNKNEKSRHELVKVLVQFVNSFSHIFKKYEDMTLLINTEDIEKDFYENIIHIQVIYNFFFFFLLK